MAADLSIRRATPADAEAIGEIHVGAHRLAYRGIAPDEYLARLDPAPRAAEWREHLAHPPASLRVWLAERAGVPIGFCGTHVAADADATGAPAPAAELHWIHVEPSYVGTGVGRALMDHALGDLRTGGVRHVVLWVLAGNERARRFYSAGGWQPDGAERTRTFRMGDNETKAIELRHSLPLI